MHIPSTIRTAFGPRHLPVRPLIQVALTPAELHAAVRHVEREATEAERDGDHATSQRLAWRAAALRETGR